MALSTQLYANNARSTLASGITNAALTFTVATGEGALFPTIVNTGDYFLVTLEVGTSREIVKVTGRSGDTFTIDPAGRAQEGTSAAAWGGGTVVAGRLTKGTLTRFGRLTDRLYELTTLDEMDRPSLMDGNSYIVHANNEAGNPIIAIKNTSNEWSFYSHEVAVVTGTVTAGNKVTAAAIVSGGTGYTIGDTLTVVGGTSYVAATLTVNTVSGGVITSVSINNPGVYTVNPGNPVSVTGGTGSGATFNLTLATANTTTSFVSTDIAALLSTFTAGKYIVQFTSGTLLGKPKRITAQKTNFVQWANADTSAPSIGDTFKIFVSNVSSISSPTFSALTLSFVPTGRVLYTTSGGAVTSSGNFTYDGTTFTVGSGSTNLFGSNVSVKDTSGFTIKNLSDPTKIAQFSLASLSTGTTRTYTLPDVTDTITTLTATQTLTNKTISGGTISGTITNSSAETKSGTFDAFGATVSLRDTITTFKNGVDSTKGFQFLCSSISTGTVRTITVPDASGTMLLTSGTLLDPSQGGVPTGAVMPFAGSAAPAGWVLCDGSAISRTTFSALFIAISTTYGAGNGSTTFNVPDLRGRAVFGKDNMGGVAANRLTAANTGVTGTTLGSAGGDERLHAHNHTATDSGHGHTLNDPGHGHGVNDPTHTHSDTNGPSSAVYGVQPGSGAAGWLTIGDSGAVAATMSYSGTGISIQGSGTGASVLTGNASISVSSTGTGGSQNLPPAIVLNYIIKT
jgi:microcystin-dependent protein